MSETDKLIESEKLKKRAGELFKVRNSKLIHKLKILFSGWSLSCCL